MKKTVTSLSFSAMRMLSSVVFFTLSFAFFTAAAYGQNKNFKEEIGDLSSKVWKTSVGIAETVTDENARMATILGQPDLQQQDRSLFLSYQRLLNYIDVSTQAGMPVGEAIVGSYEKVIGEVPYDVDLKHLPEGALMTLVPQLVELLSAVPVPDILTGQ